MTNRSISLNDTALSTLINELGAECSYVLGLIYQLQLPNLLPDQKAEILAELLAATIHLHAHCDDKFQDAILNELESLPD